MSVSRSKSTGSQLRSPLISEANPFKVLGIETDATIHEAYVAYEHKAELYGVANGGQAQDVESVRHAYCMIHEAKLGTKSMIAWVEITIRGTANAAGILVLVLLAAMDHKLLSRGMVHQGYVGAFVIAMMCLNTALGDNIGSSDKPPPLLDGKTSPTQSDDAISHNVNLMDRGELPFSAWNRTLSNPF